jgi:hypothetical protein
LAREGGLDFENGVDAFGGDVHAGAVREQGRGMERVEDGEVDLARADSMRVEDEGGGGVETLGQIAFKQLLPVMFGGGSSGRGVLERASDVKLGQHFVLDSECGREATSCGRNGHVIDTL